MPLLVSALSTKNAAGANPRAARVYIARSASSVTAPRSAWPMESSAVNVAGGAVKVATRGSTVPAAGVSAATASVMP
jgi:hypothetical protein